MQPVRTGDEAHFVTQSHLASKLLRKIRQGWPTVSNLNDSRIFQMNVWLTKQEARALPEELEKLTEFDKPEINRRLKAMWWEWHER